MPTAYNATVFGASTPQPRPRNDARGGCDAQSLCANKHFRIRLGLVDLVASITASNSGKMPVLQNDFRVLLAEPSATFYGLARALEQVRFGAAQISDASICLIMST